MQVVVYSDFRTARGALRIVPNTVPIKQLLDTISYYRLPSKISQNKHTATYNAIIY